MYAAATGTFLQRDPAGPEGDGVLGYSHQAVTRIMRSRNRHSSFPHENSTMNLYEYVNSNPLKYLDPMGAQIYVDDGSGYPPWYIEVSLTPTNGVTPNVQVDTSCPSYRTVQDGVKSSCKCLQNAKQLLQNRPDDLTSYYLNRKGSVATGLGTAAGRAQLLKQIDQALKACDGTKPLKVFCPCSCEKGTDAFVNFLGFTNIVTGVGINLCPSWFSRGGDWTRVLHEMGRFYNSMGEDFTGTAADVYAWDDKLFFLCNKEEELNIHMSGGSGQ